MNIIEAFILGLVQGLGEFLPISSSGHLVFFRNLLNIQGDTQSFLFFDTMLHVATLFAILIVLFKDILALFKPPFKTIGFIILSAIPAVIAFFFLGDYAESAVQGGWILSIFFLVTAIILFITEVFSKKYTCDKELSLKTVAFMGVMQVIALFPGISRSGSTIAGGTFSKTKREQVAKFSFFMSVPIILGSAFLQFLKLDSITVDILPLVVGMITAFLSGLLAIKLMLKLIAKANYKWFSLYLVVIAVINLVITLL